MKIFFWIGLLAAGIVPATAWAQNDASSLEKRIESWRPWMKSGQAERVIDSCRALLPALSARRQPLQRALALSLLASASTQMGQPAAALPLHRQALALRRRFLGETRLETANSYQNIGNCLLALGHTREAGPVLKKALVLKEHIFKDTAQELIRIYNSYGQYRQNEFDFKQAHHYLERALAISEIHFGPNGLQIIPRLMALAALGTVESNHDAALLLLLRAYTIQADSDWNDAATKIKLFQNLGNAYGAKGSYAEALRWLHTALQYSEQHAGISITSRNDLLYAIGNVLLDQGDFASAETTLLSALAGLPENGSTRADVLNSLGLALRYQRRPDAVDSLVVAGNLYLHAPVNPLNQQTVAGIWQNVGNCHLDRSEYKAAKYYFEKALAHLAQVPGAEALQASCWDKIGVCHLAMGEAKVAAGIWQLLLQKRSTLPMPVVYAILYHRGQLYVQQQNWAAAASDYEQTLATLRNPGPTQYVPFPYEYTQTLSALALMWQTRAQHSHLALDWTKALDWATQAVDALQNLKAQLRASRSAIELQQIFDTPFDVAVAANLALDKPEAAWHFAELFKSNFLQKLSWQAGIHADFRMPANLIKNETEWNNALVYYQRLLNEPAEHLSGRKSALADSIQRISERLYQLRLDISQRYPDVYRCLYEPDLPALSEVKQTLDPEQSLLEYHWGAPDQIAVFVIRRDTFAAMTLPLGTNTAGDIVAFFQHCAQNPFRLPDASRTAYCDELATLGQGLYQKMIAPLEALLRDQVLIVPDATLCILPFEALLVKRGTPAYRMDQHHYWMQEHSISYAHSAASWLTMRKQTLPAGKRSMLVVAPDFAYSTKGLSSLEYNRSEATAVCDVTGGTGMLGPEARKETFLQEAGRFATLHLATHGVMNDQEPLASFVAFTEFPNDSSGSNLLYVSDIYSSRFPAELIVLSACQTASGRLFRGEGLLSIAQAFQFAGTQSLVASLWNVDDQRTPGLMKEFFKNLWDKMPKNEALSQAKRGYLQTHRGLDAHPCFWAGLLLTGSEKPLTETGRWHWYWWVVLGTVIAGGFVYLIVRRWK